MYIISQITIIIIIAIVVIVIVIIIISIIIIIGAPFPRRALARAVAGAHQRHINGVVSKNTKYNNFGFGGIKRPF